jgi:RND family efflux transporter MFP subunit
MTGTRILVGLCLVGVLIALFAIVDTNRPVPVPTAATLPARNPFASAVAAVGITEIGRGNIAVATTVPGVVQALYVKTGDSVAGGDPLFKIDDRDLQARLGVELAKVAEARAALDKPRHRLDFIRHLTHLDATVVSKQAVSDLQDDVDAAEAAMNAADAAATQTKVDIERATVRAPTAGRILQVNIRAGEYADTRSASTPPILMGDDTRMYVRTDVDESEAWRIRPAAPAVAFVRGNPGLRAPLRFEYIEPYVTPKASLTGQSTERPDVRVLQVVYSFERAALPVYVGQQMDVFIEAAPVHDPGALAR